MRTPKEAIEEEAGAYTTPSHLIYVQEAIMSREIRVRGFELKSV